MPYAACSPSVALLVDAQRCGGIGALLHNLQYDLLWRECRQGVGLASTDLVSLEPVDLLFSKSWCTFLLATDADQVTPKGIAQRYVHELIRPWHSIGESICDGGVVGGVGGKQEERQLSFGHQHPNGLADKQTTWSTQTERNPIYAYVYRVTPSEGCSTVFMFLLGLEHGECYLGSKLLKT